MKRLKNLLHGEDEVLSPPFCFSVSVDLTVCVTKWQVRPLMTAT